ncbi:hypothetical protein DAI43_17095 [Achromobacter xylosoxidans]|nr:hypothetical protein DAI43_17095 [Achromobacter xylosoxidans]
MAGELEIRLEKYADELRALSTIGVVAARSGWKQGSAEWLVCELELQKRLNRPNNLRAWLAIAISAVSIVVAVVALVKG